MGWDGTVDSEHPDYKSTARAVLITWNTTKYLILTFPETEELTNVWESQLPVQQPGDPPAADLPDDHEQREHHGQPQVLRPAGLL